MCFLGTHFVFGYFLSILLKFWSNVYTAFFSFNCIFTYGDLNKITFLAPHPKHGMGNPAMQPHCRGCRVADLVVRAAMQNPQSQIHTHLHIHTHIKSGSQHTIGVLSKLLPFYTFGLLILFSRWHSYRLAPNYSNVCDILLGCIHFRSITHQVWWYWGKLLRESLPLHIHVKFVIDMKVWTPRVQVETLKHMLQCSTYWINHSFGRAHSM